MKAVASNLPAIVDTPGIGELRPARIRIDQINQPIEHSARVEESVSRGADHLIAGVDPEGPAAGGGNVQNRRARSLPAKLVLALILFVASARAAEECPRKWGR